MPELGEVALMAALVQSYSSHRFHSVSRSAVARLGPDIPIPRCWSAFRIDARSRGKELHLDLHPTAIDPALRREEEQQRQTSTVPDSPPANGKGKARAGAVKGQRVHPPHPVIPLDGPLPLLLRMGMTGHMAAFNDPGRTHKHAHLTFEAKEPTPLAVCFVDQRQFGRWLVVEGWDETRSPCLWTEYAAFRRHVVEALEKGSRALEKPLCEVLLDQAFFNGVGNYLRAEICHRAGANPFASASSALKGLTVEEQKGSPPDLLRVAHDLIKEVIDLGDRYFSPDPDRKVDEAEAGTEEATSEVSPSELHAWQRCYERHDLGMVSTVDSKNRAMWHEKRWAQKGRTKAGPRRPPKKGMAAKAAKATEEAREAEGEAAADEAEDGEAAVEKKEGKASATAARGKKGGRKRKTAQEADRQPRKAARSKRLKAEEMKEVEIVEEVVTAEAEEKAGAPAGKTTEEGRKRTSEAAAGAQRRPAQTNRVKAEEKTDEDADKAETAPQSMETEKGRTRRASSRGKGARKPSEGKRVESANSQGGQRQR